MKKYIVTIEEICDEDFEIIAESAEVALGIAIEKYKNQDIVLEPGNITFKQIAISKPNTECTEWLDF